jgi:hypothetical protein
MKMNVNMKKESKQNNCLCCIHVCYIEYENVYICIGTATDYDLDGRFPATDFPLLYIVQTGSGAHPAPGPVGTGTLSLELYRLRRETDTHYRLVLRSRDVELYLHALYIIASQCLII